MKLSKIIRVLGFWVRVRFFTIFALIAFVRVRAGRRSSGGGSSSGEDEGTRERERKLGVIDCGYRDVAEAHRARVREECARALSGCGVCGPGAPNAFWNSTRSIRLSSFSDDEISRKCNHSALISSTCNRHAPYADGKSPGQKSSSRKVSKAAAGGVVVRTEK